MALEERQYTIDETEIDGVTVQTVDIPDIGDSESGSSASLASKTKYDISDFQPTKASGISLGVVTGIDTSGEDPANIAFGAGICKKIDVDKYQVTINGKAYIYNSKGEGISHNALGTKLKTGGIDYSEDTISTSGNDFGGTTSGSTITVNSLNARDEFAIHILDKLLKGVPDPALLSTDEMAYYSKLAYTWAVYMLREAASGRDNNTTGSASSYSSNTEALLDKIADAITNSSGAEGGTTNVDFDDLIDALTGSNSGSGLKVTTMPSLSVTETGTINIGSSGLGRNVSNPLYISGAGVFPSKNAVSSQYYSDTSQGASSKVSDFLAFNSNGTVGYITLKEAQKVILGWMSQAGDGNVSATGDVLTKSDFIDSLLDTTTAQQKLANYVVTETNFISAVKNWIVDLIQDTSVTYNGNACTVIAPTLD